MCVSTCLCVQVCVWAHVYVRLRAERDVCAVNAPVVDPGELTYNLFAFQSPSCKLGDTFLVSNELKNITRLETVPGTRFRHMLYY